MSEKNLFRNKKEESIAISEIEEYWQSFFKFPEQGVRILKNGQAFVWLKAGEEIEVKYDLARFILVSLRLRIKELKYGVGNFKFQFLKKIIYLSNCHRVMLAALGFPFSSLLENNFGSKIIESFFDGGRESIGENVLVENVFSKLESFSESDFPVAINFFSQGEIDGESSLAARHSALILGKTNQGQYIVFHKDGLGDGNPVELVDLQSILNSEAEIYEDKLVITIAKEADILKNYQEIISFAKTNLV